MQFHTGHLALLLAGFASQSGATTPPPKATVDIEVCQATHVFIGTASKVRFVNANNAKFCSGEPAEQNGALTNCGSAEVEVKIDRVLYPTNWLPAKPVIYRFGGGLFSTESLRADLEGKSLIFHVKFLGEGLVRDNAVMLFGPSYPWVLAKQPSEIEQVNEVLSKCAR